MKQAVMDIGTNSIRLLVAELSPEGMRTVCKTLRTTRLGDGLESGKALGESARLRTLEGVAELIAEARACGATEVTAVGTNALREAADGAAFAAEIGKVIGASVRIIDGTEEARYSYLGAAKESSTMTGVVDIGGGSTEIAVGFSGELGVAVSMPLGAVRGSRDFDMMTPRGIGELKKHCFAVLAERAEEVQGISRWIGVGGTMTSMAAIVQKLSPYDAAKVQGYRLSYETVQKLLHCLAMLSYEERRELPGLQPERADIIVAGVAIAESLMEYFALPEMAVSDADLLEGVWWETYGPGDSV